MLTNDGVLMKIADLFRKAKKICVMHICIYIYDNVKISRVLDI